MNTPKHPRPSPLHRIAWLLAAIFTLAWSASAANPVVLFQDNFTATGTGSSMWLNYNQAARQAGSGLGAISYTTDGNCQAGNPGEPHDGGNVLLCAGARAALLQNFNGALSAGGLMISFDLDANAHNDLDTSTWGAVALGAGFGDRHTFVVGGAPHFGILFRANGGIQAFDGGGGVSGAEVWAPDGNYSVQMHHFDIVLTGPGDGNPFDGVGDTQIDVFADGSPTPCYSYTKVGGYANNYINFQANTVADFDNLVITQLDAPAAPVQNHWSIAPWTSDADIGVDSQYSYTHAYNLGSLGNAYVNGVWFTQAGCPNGGSINLSGNVSGKFTLTASPGGWLNWGPPGAPTPNVTGYGWNMAAEFLYNGNPETLTLQGLTPGTPYVLTLFAWGFDIGAGGIRMNTFSVGPDQAVIDQDAFTGDGRNNGIRVSYAYTADQTGTLTVNITPLVANNTFHFSGFCNTDFSPGTPPPPPGPWTHAIWTNDVTSGVSPLHNYTHAYTFGGNAIPANINTIQFIPAPGANPANNDPLVGGTFALNQGGDPGVYTVDAGNTVSGDSANLAHSFIYNAFPGTLTLSGLTPGTEYVLSLFSTDWDGTPGRRLISFTNAAGGDQSFIDQDAFGPARNGIVISYPYTAASDTLTIQAMPVGFNSFHWYGFANREVALKPTPPIIILDPKGLTVTEGETLTLSGDAAAYPDPTFLWLTGIDKTPIDPPQTGKTLSFAPITAANAGDYYLAAFNVAGAATSHVATISVGLPMANSSFEADLVGVGGAFPDWPYYANTGANGPVTDWSFTSTAGYGLNTSAGPFADNGTIPLGGQVVFIQAPGTLSRTVTGLTQGASYYVSYYENARVGSPGTPALQVIVDDGVAAPFEVVPAHPITPVGAAQPYRHVDSVGFVANSDTITLSFVKSDWVAGDSSALIDNVAVVPQPEGAVPVIEQQPLTTSGNLGGTARFAVVASGSPFVTYQWYKGGTPIDGATSGLLVLANLNPLDDDDYWVVLDNGTPVESAHAHLTVITPLARLYNTGVDDTGAVLPSDGTRIDPHYLLTENSNDPNSQNAYVQQDFNGDGTAHWPIAAGVWFVNDTVSKWIGPTGDPANNLNQGQYTYAFNLDLTDRDPTTAYATGQFGADNGVTDIIVNGTSIGTVPAGGFGGWTGFSITAANASLAAGPNTVEFKVSNAGEAPNPIGFRVQWLSSHAKFVGNVAPIFIQQPQGADVSVGDTVVLSAIVVGIPQPTLQWFKNGQPIDGQTGPTLTLASVTTQDTATYTLTAANEANPAGLTSQPAVVNVLWEHVHVPGLYGTGVDDSGALLPDGAADLHWLLTASADPATPANNPARVVNSAYPIQAGVWLLNGPNSKWIAPMAVQTTGNNAGDYVFSTAFDLSGIDLTRFSLRGGWAVDNGISALTINGNPLGAPTVNGFQTLTPFVLPGSALLPGMNFVDVTVNNAGTAANPTGLRIDIAGYLDVQAAPRLTLTLNGDRTLTVTWDPADPWTLEWTESLTTPNWQAIPGAVSGYTTGAIAPSDPPKFFRLVSP